MKDKKSSLKERFRALEESHRAKLERLHRSHDESLKIFQEDTQKNLTEALPEWRSSLILHAQVVVGPLALSKVDFDFLKDIYMESLNFNVNHPKGEEWETF